MFSRALCLVTVLAAIPAAHAADDKLTKEELAEMEKSIGDIKAPPLAELKDPDGKDVAAVAAEVARRQNAQLPRRIMLKRVSADHYAVWKKAAEGGDRDAMYLCGAVDAYGSLGPCDFQSANGWYRRAADAGQPTAAVEHAICLYTGNGVTRDKKQAVALLRKHAEQDDPTALWALGHIYAIGGGFDSSTPAEGLRLLWKAAVKGHAKAMNEVGVCFGRGIGVAVDRVTETKWYAKGIEFGYHQCMYNIAANYYAGTGVPQDYAEAAKWYERAAVAGNGGGMLQLSVMFEDGLGVKRNRAEAVKWGQRAVDAGAPQAKSWLQQLEAPPRPANFSAWAPAYGSTDHQRAIDEVNRAVRDYQQQVIRNNPHLVPVRR
jgi:TPR repeat protein